MHRPTVGLIALLLLALSGVVPLFSSESAWHPACLRVGLLMGAFWLAMPALQGVRPIWVSLGLAVAIVGLIVATKHPFQTALLAMIVLLLGYLSISQRRRPTGKTASPSRRAPRVRGQGK
jgi:hypothetical protein